LGRNDDAGVFTGGEEVEKGFFAWLLEIGKQDDGPDGKQDEYPDGT
jgi:hypothetical protein